MTNTTALNIDVIYLATMEPTPSFLVRFHDRVSAWVNAYCMAVAGAWLAIVDAWKDSADAR